jgi:sucrose-phosphate synthase
MLQIECEETQRFTKHLLEHEQSCKDATEDISEDLSEGERNDVINDMYIRGDGQRKSKLSRINSVDVIEAWANEEKEKKLYIVLIRYIFEIFLWITARCHKIG